MVNSHQQPIPPPHFIKIKSSSLLIIDQFDFAACDDQVYMTAKDYKIETSIDGETWDTVYSGTVSATDIYIEKNANSNQ